MANIVIIDNDEEDSYLLQQAIHQVRPRVNCFLEDNSSIAMRKLASKDVPKPDLIFLDFKMPGELGVQCLRELKNDPELHSVPIVIYTRSKSPDERAESLTLGADYFISKPPSFRQICRAVSEIFDQEIRDR